MTRNGSGYPDPTAGAAMRGDNNITAPNHGKLRATLPPPPSVNHYYVTTRAGRRVMTARAEAWMQEAQWIVKAAARAAGWRMSVGRKTIMRLWIYWPDARRRDVGNLHKALADAPEGIVYRDDKMVLIRDMDFQVDRKNPRVEMEIEEVTA